MGSAYPTAESGVATEKQKWVTCQDRTGGREIVCGSVS